VSAGRAVRHAWSVVMLACGARGLAAQVSSRPRLLGVFEEATGKPIEGAEIVDLKGGTTALTTETGTISLAYLPAGSTLLRVRKVGYTAQTLAVVVSPSDTAGVTVALAPVVATLPAVVTRGRQPADTVRRLELSGFYERRQSGRAPASAFITVEQLEKWKPSLLGDLKHFTGRAPCGDIYINGSRVAAGSMGRGNAYRSGIDALVTPPEIAGIEIYNRAEAPSQYGGTTVTKVPRCVVTLIWLK
jgi:hypothetical protein